jgi:hypothetical protein
MDRAELVTKFPNSSTIADTIVRVLTRRRFGIDVQEAHLGPWIARYHVHKDGMHYQLMVHLGETSTGITMVSVSEGQAPESSSVDPNTFFFHKNVKHNKMPNIRCIGTTIANKIKMRPLHDVMGA